MTKSFLLLFGAPIIIGSAVAPAVSYTNVNNNQLLAETKSLTVDSTESVYHPASGPDGANYYCAVLLDLTQNGIDFPTLKIGYSIIHVYNFWVTAPSGSDPNLNYPILNNDIWHTSARTGMDEPWTFMASYGYGGDGSWCRTYSAGHMFTRNGDLMLRLAYRVWTDCNGKDLVPSGNLDNVRVDIY